MAAVVPLVVRVVPSDFCAVEMVKQGGADVVAPYVAVAGTDAAARNARPLVFRQTFDKK